MSISEQQYANWSVAEFMADPAFQASVIEAGRNRESERFFDRLQLKYPHLKPVMEEAAEMIRELIGEQQPGDAEGEVLVWKAVQQQMRESRQQPISGKLYAWRSVAAIALPLVAITALTLWLKSGNEKQVVEITDNRGAFKLINLPDSSKVMLGANSNIRYDEKWNGKGAREVWLKGDAHFEVKHLNQKESKVTENEKFLVHVNDQVDIEVLGTVFNVWNRNGKTEVELESGKVKLIRKGSKDQLILRPGEVATITKESIGLNTEKSDLVLEGPDHDKLYDLNNTSVAEIITLIQNTYGKKVIVEDTTLLSRRIDGVLPLCHEKDLLFALSGILDIRVRQTDAQTWVFHTAE